MYSVGEAVTISCGDGSGSADMVEWLNSTEAVLFSGSSSATLTIDVLMDSHHGSEYTCRLHSSGVTKDLIYTVVVLSK